MKGAKCVSAQPNAIFFSPPFSSFQSFSLPFLPPLIFLDITLSQVHDGLTHFVTFSRRRHFAQFFTGWADCCWQLEPCSPLHYWSCPPRTEAEAKRAQMGRKEGRRRGGGGLCTCEPETHHYDYETESRRTMTASFHEKQSADSFIFWISILRLFTKSSALLAKAEVHQRVICLPIYAKWALGLRPHAHGHP